MTNSEAMAIRDAALHLQSSIQSDIINASTRQEHMRLTQLATEAERLVAAIDLLIDQPQNSMSPVPDLHGYLPTHM